MVQMHLQEKEFMKACSSLLSLYDLTDDIQNIPEAIVCVSLSLNNYDHISLFDKLGKHRISMQALAYANEWRNREWISLPAFFERHGFVLNASNSFASDPNNKAILVRRVIEYVIASFF
jgi:hypothetical protein